MKDTKPLQTPLKSRALDATKSCLEKKGYEIVGSTDRGLVAVENGELVFVSVLVRMANKTKGFAEDLSNREKREIEACQWLAENPTIDPLPFRFDEVSLIVVSDDRAILRHHINCLDSEEVA